jgi:Fe-S cluster assembly scaffold protein SufB
LEKIGFFGRFSSNTHYAYSNKIGFVYSEHRQLSSWDDIPEEIRKAISALRIPDGLERWGDCDGFGLKVYL